MSSGRTNTSVMRRHLYHRLDHDAFPPAAAALNRVCGSKSVYSRRSVRATVSNVTRAAPARFSTLAQADAVAPVVNTSSTNKTRCPFKDARRRNAKTPRTLARRWALVNPDCGVDALTRFTALLTGTPHLLAISLANKSD